MMRQSELLSLWGLVSPCAFYTSVLVGLWLTPTGFMASSVRRRRDAGPDTMPWTISYPIAHCCWHSSHQGAKWNFLNQWQTPDGMTLVPWSTDNPLTWDVTVTCLLATSYLDAAASSNNARSAADTAVKRKTAKYANLGAQFLFQPTAVESLGPMHESARQFLVDLSHKITARSRDDHEGSFLFHHTSVLLHCFYSILLHDSFVSVHCPDWWLLHSLFYIQFFYTPLVFSKG